MTALPDDRAVGAVARFEGELRRFVARRVSGPDADDVMQDTLLRIHLGIGALRSAEHLAPWVYRVARSAIIDHHRRSRPVHLVDEPPEEALPEEPSEDVRRLLAACVSPFLENLTAEQAEALRLTDLGGLTQAEAATRLGVPLPTLKARVQRGRRKMREEFEACCELEQDGRGAVIGAKPRCGC
ncbi:MAG: sigma-70 family RNA polymerase sigma factor [Pseudomonadota bacterium]|nr:sigma-70 family RNA polymerase sigma factor [Pseudomonadota bacterium]